MSHAHTFGPQSAANRYCGQWQLAAWVGEETGDYRAVQTALGHQDLRTTSIYAQRLGVRRDNVSTAIAQKRELPPLPIERGDDQA